MNAPRTPPPRQPSFWRKGLNKTRLIFEKIGVVDAPWTEADFNACEDALHQADCGIKATMALIQTLKNTPDKRQPILTALRQAVHTLLRPLEPPVETLASSSPKVIMMVGINGCGKTTTIAKLTHHFLQANRSVVLAAGDTFRAAAREQLKHWGERANVRVIEQAGGDPAAVAFSAIQSGLAQGNDVVLVDTAGRLPTQKHLMAELSRIHKVCAKAMAGAPHEVWLVLDGTQGQNTLAQIRQFHESVPITGLIITKLDGSAKGGFLCALAEARLAVATKSPPLPIIPVRFVGVGEQPEDLQIFNAEAFAHGMV